MKNNPHAPAIRILLCAKTFRLNEHAANILADKIQISLFSASMTILLEITGYDALRHCPKLKLPVYPMADFCKIIDYRDDECGIDIPVGKFGEAEIS